MKQISIPTYYIYKVHIYITASRVKDFFSSIARDQVCRPGTTRVSQNVFNWEVNSKDLINIVGQVPESLIQVLYHPRHHRPPLLFPSGFCVVHVRGTANGVRDISNTPIF